MERGEIASEEQFLLLSTIFCYLMLDFYFKTRIRFSLPDKQLFEITEVEIARVVSIYNVDPKKVHFVKMVEIQNGLPILHGKFFVCLDCFNIQSTLVISTSVISNNRLSRRENLVLVLTQKSKIRLQNIVEKRRKFLPFSTIFSIYISNYKSQIT